MKGWHDESYRHALAAHGVRTRDIKVPKDRWDKLRWAINKTRETGNHNPLRWATNQGVARDHHGAELALSLAWSGEFEAALYIVDMNGMYYPPEVYKRLAKPEEWNIY